MADVCRYEERLQALELHTFGAVGTRLVLDLAGFMPASAAFRERAVARAIEAVADADSRWQEGSPVAASAENSMLVSKRKRVFGYLEYSISGGPTPAGAASDGDGQIGSHACEGAGTSELRERGLRLEGTAACWSGGSSPDSFLGAGPLLRPARLPFPAAAVDRARCAEFQLLASLVAQAQTAGVLQNVPRAGALVSGTVCLYTTTAPCPSCVGVMVQLQQLFPLVRIAVSFPDACDSEPLWDVTMPVGQPAI